MYGYYPADYSIHLTKNHLINPMLNKTGRENPGPHIEHC